MRPLATKYSSFKGWYISEEIDDINWRSFESQQVLFHYLEKLTKHLRVLTPDKQVALSGFSNGALSPDSFQTFWSELLVRANVDTVLFQDGIGVNKLQLDNLHHYLKAMRNAALATGTELQAISKLSHKLQVFQSTISHFRQSLHRWKELFSNFRLRHNTLKRILPLVFLSI